MSLKPSQVWRSLQAKQADFQAFTQENQRLLQVYRQALARVSRQTSTEIEIALANLTGANLTGVSALPLEPLDSLRNWVVASQLQWQNREQSLEWVREHLQGVTTFAVDGSQIFPSKDLSLPVALIQIGWFENLHLPSGDYEKDVLLEVLTPAELDAGGQQRPAERQVNLRRFQLETQRLIDYITDHSGHRECLVFLDGSLVATFAEAFDADARAVYVQCLLSLLRASETHQVPLVAYIDTSTARDLLQLLQHLCHLPPAPNLTDAQLLLPLMSWGDRTPLFRCQRGSAESGRGVLSSYAEQSERIGFVYLKTNEGPPARLELPLWLYEAGRLPQVLNWVRGEVIIGSGYPYVIETADQSAVLQGDDRQAFLRILQEWADQAGLQLRFSRKLVSKANRR